MEGGTRERENIVILVAMLSTVSDVKPPPNHQKIKRRNTSMDGKL